MTEMNLESLREHLAIEVMGWQRHCDYWGTEVIGSGKYTIYTWKPDENIEQAMLCLFEFRDWELTRDSMDGYTCCIRIQGADGRLAYGKSTGPQIAICEAVARATGWVEESVCGSEGKQHSERRGL